MAKSKHNISVAKTTKADAKAQSAAATRRERLRQQEEMKAKDDRKMRLFTAIGVLLGIALVVTVVMVLVNQRMKSEAAQIDPPHAISDRTAVSPFTFTEGAPTLSVYSDFRCNGCQTVHNSFGAIFQSLAEEGKINLEYHYVDQIGGKESSVSNNMSTRANLAATCADTVGKFTEASDAIWAYFPNNLTDAWLRDTMPTTAGITGDDLTKFQQCYADKATVDFVNNMAVQNWAFLTEANAPEQPGTPALFVNGKKLASLPDGATAESVLAAIQELAGIEPSASPSADETPANETPAETPAADESAPA